jgi:hypothetical protein
LSLLSPRAVARRRSNKTAERTPAAARLACTAEAAGRLACTAEAAAPPASRGRGQGASLVLRARGQPARAELVAPSGQPDAGAMAGLRALAWEERAAFGAPAESGSRDLEEREVRARAA